MADRQLVEFEVDREDGAVVLSWREGSVFHSMSIAPISARSLSLALREASRGREKDSDDVFPVQIVVKGEFSHG